MGWVDPVAGLAVAIPILWLLVTSARHMLRRLIDAIEPEIVDEVADAVAGVEGVHAVEELRVRWYGHQLRITASIAVNPDLTVKQGHDIAHDVEHELRHRFTVPIAATIHVEPHGHTDRHDRISHHSQAPGSRP